MSSTTNKSYYAEKVEALLYNCPLKTKTSIAKIDTKLFEGYSKHFENQDEAKLEVTSRASSPRSILKTCNTHFYNNTLHKLGERINSIESTDEDEILS